MKSLRCRANDQLVEEEALEPEALPLELEHLLRGRVREGLVVAHACQHLAFRWGLGSKVQGSGLMVYGLWFMVYGLGFGVQGFGFRI